MAAEVGRPLLLVGSLPFDSVEEAMRTAGELIGERLRGIPDGEVGPRKMWVGFLPFNVYFKHPDLRVTRSQEEYLDPDLQPDSRPEVWEPPTQFAVNPGVTEVRFEELGYAAAASESYKTFKQLRAEGVIPEATRFQVCLPGTGSAVSSFFSDPDEWPIVHAAYHDAIGREIEQIVDVVPADDLQLQFDFAWELVDLASGDGVSVEHWPRETFEDKVQRHAATIGPLTEKAPPDVPVGIHWCYGTWGGWPMKDMADLSICVRMSNEAVRRAKHDVAYFHMPVIEDPDDEFFAPLDDLDIGDAAVYLGLIHSADGIEACSRRIKLARRHLDHFGVGHVCGYGRENPSELPDIFRLHEECARLLHEV